MSKLITIIRLLINLTAVSQTNAEKQDKWKIGLTYAQDFYFNTVLTDKVFRSEQVPSEYNFTIGLIGQWTIKPKLAIGTGLAYSGKNYSRTIDCKDCVYFPDIMYIKQQYLEIPLFVRYLIFEKKPTLHVETGMMGAYLIKDITGTKGGYSTNIDSQFKILLTGWIGVGVDFDIGQRINLSLTTTYNNSLADFSDEIKFKLRSFGFVTEIAYSIKKPEKR